MSFEGSEKESEAPILLSLEEFKRISDSDIDSEELGRWMRENNVTFNTGPRRLEIDGKEEFMETAKENWGVLLSAEDVRVIRGGQELGCRSGKALI